VEVVRDLVACLGLVRPVVVGHSLGGHIALSAVGDGLDAAGLFLFGTPPVSFPPDLARLFHLDVLGDLFFRGRITESEISAMAALCMPEDVEPPEYYARSIRATDPGARDMLGAAIADGGMVDEQAILDSVGCPTALVLGECDRIVRLDYLRGVQFPMLWRGSAQVIPGAGHCPQYDDPVSFNRLMAGFVDALPL
jgi:pimeloyl-ACP methyl ester carboxylesterase